MRIRIYLGKFYLYINLIFAVLIYNTGGWFKFPDPVKMTEIVSFYNNGEYSKKVDL